MAFDPYGLLGVRASATPDEIRQAYRALARKLHPDVNHSEDSAERFKEMGLAFSILSDNSRRALFDEFGEESMHLNFDPSRARRRRGPSRRTRSSASPERADPATRRRPPARQQRRGGHSAPSSPVRAEPQRSGRRSTDVTVPLHLDLALALTGGQLRVPSPVGGAAVTVQIPPGVSGGHRFRIPGRGRPGHRGGKPGDLHLEVVIDPHPYFRRDGRNLVLELPVTVQEAHRGAEVRIPTLEGWLRIRVPAGSQGGERLRLQGKGPQLPGGRRGDMYVHLCVRLPPRLGAAGRALDQICQLYDDSVRKDLKL